MWFIFAPLMLSFVLQPLFFCEHRYTHAYLMSLKKRFWEASQNGLGFFCFCCVLDVFTTIATPLYLYLQVLCQVLASYGGGSKSCGMLSRKQILFDSLQKSWKKSPVHLFELNFLHSMLYTIVNLPYVLSFLIWAIEVHLKKQSLQSVLFWQII